MLIKVKHGQRRFFLTSIEMLDGYLQASNTQAVDKILQIARQRGEESRTIELDITEE